MKHSKQKNLESKSGPSPSISLVQMSDNKNDDLIISFGIPEPTRSLLWITNEDLSKISSPMSYRMSFSFDEDNVDVNFDDGRNFFGEPSLIWTRLPIHSNNELETKPMYYPSYSALSPMHRYQYLNWLRDITQRTNLSYVFLYYYGLERHLLGGNFDLAVDEIVKLINTQEPKFKSYVMMPLLMAIGYKNRVDVLNRLPFLLEDDNDLSLWIRSMTSLDLRAKDIIKLNYHIGFTNKRYIKLYPQLFEQVLQSNIDTYTSIHGPLLSQIDKQKLPKRSMGVFLNLSIPDNIRYKEIPDMLTDEEFKRTLFSLLQMTHDQIKESKKSKKPILN